MRKHFVAFLAALTVIAGLGVMGASPASAHPKVCVAQGTATTGALGLPVPPRTVSWSITSNVAVCVDTAPPGVQVGATVTGSGTLTGGCGQSTGTGNVSLNGDAHTVSWVSLASLLIINPVLPASATTVGVVNAVADPTVPNNSCVLNGGTATKFLVQGIIAGI